MANHKSNINSLSPLLLCNIVTGLNITLVKSLSITAYRKRLEHSEVVLISVPRTQTFEKLSADPK